MALEYNPDQPAPQDLELVLFAGIGYGIQGPYKLIVDQVPKTTHVPTLTILRPKQTARDQSSYRPGGWIGWL